MAQLASSSSSRAAGKAHEEIVDSGNRRLARAKYLRTGAHVNYSRDSIRLSLVFDYRCDLRLCLVKGRARAANRGLFKRGVSLLSSKSVIIPYSVYSLYKAAVHSLKI